MNALTQGHVDHLVVYAETLDVGMRWCVDTLGVTPGPGGEHPLMGTHNRLLAIASDAFPDAYLEIIACQPGAAPPAAAKRRWFDLDDPHLKARVARDGPQLVHWVARVPDAAASVAALAVQDIDRAMSWRPAAGPPPACCNGASRCGRTGSACSTVACRP